MTALAIDLTGTNAPPRCTYQEQNCSMTLAEGLSEYYRANQGRVLRPSELSAESRALFASHDMCHVIFGLGTTLDDEVMADTRTLLSCDVGMRRYLRYLAITPEAKALFEELGYARAIWATIFTMPRILKAIREMFRVTQRWPWTPPEEYLERPLAELRRRHGIRVV